MSAPVIGLTGNYASGKSHIAEIFRGLGAAVQDSDKVAHEVLNDEAFARIAIEFPKAIENEKINRQLLGAEVFGNNEKMQKLESIIHPIVRQRNLDFITEHKNKSKVIVLEIPLLFETRAETICDYVIFINVPREIQKARALARPGMTEEKFKKVLALQEKIPVEEKKERADFVIENHPGADITKEVELILEEVQQAV